MQKRFQVAALAGALSIVMSSSAIAAKGDLEFGGWSVDNGKIGWGNAAVCRDGSGYNCSLIAKGTGFAQVKVDVDINDADMAGKDSYVMTIVTDQDADAAKDGDLGLGFSDVSFIKMKITLGVAGQQNADNVGMTGRQLINELANGTQFDSTTLINTGWASTDNANPLQITQTLKNDGDTLDVGDDFEAGFTYKSTATPMDADGKTTRNGYFMDISQLVGLAALDDPESTNDTQSFALRQRQGTFVETDGNVSFELGGGGKTMDWKADEEIKAMWMGQSISSMSSHFGYMSYDNLVDVYAADVIGKDKKGNDIILHAAGTAIAPIADFDLTSSVAQQAWGDWNTAAFGNKPCAGNPKGTPLPDGSGGSTPAC